METQTGRNFIAAAVTLGVVATASAIPDMEPKNKKQLAHHVFFWLKNPGSKDDLNKLIDGLKTLEKIESVRRIHIGVPASTEKRPVVESGYSASELIFFDDVVGQNIYQEHPIHKKFVDQCSHLWEKVIVYDSIDI